MINDLEAKKDACIRYARDLLIESEGICLTEYICTAGYRTIGVGQRIDVLSEAQKRKCVINALGGLSIDKNTALDWLEQRISVEVERLYKESYFKELDCVRQAVIVDLVYNLGFKGWNNFKKTIALLGVKDYAGASLELLDSKWAKQVGIRAKRNAYILQFGRYDKAFY